MSGEQVNQYVDTEKGTYSSVTVFSSTNMLSGSVGTSQWVDISQTEIKTISIISSQSSGTLEIQVSPTSSTTTAYSYYTDNSIPSNTFTTKSFTEVFYWVRIKFTPSADSTVDAWISKFI